jgi:hypothetical protein
VAVALGRGGDGSHAPASRASPVGRSRPEFVEPWFVSGDGGLDDGDRGPWMSLLRWSRAVAISWVDGPVASGMRPTIIAGRAGWSRPRWPDLARCSRAGPQFRRTRTIGGVHGCWTTCRVRVCWGPVANVWQVIATRRQSTLCEREGEAPDDRGQRYGALSRATSRPRGSNP